MEDGWKTDALSAEVGGDEWFPEKGDFTQAAKRTCTRCAVRDECLDYALDRNERFGIWGGKSVRERDALARSGWLRVAA